MDMRSAVPDWLTPVAWTYIALSLLSVAVIAADIYLARRRHDSVATELVWITSGLYLGPFAIPVYLNRGRAGNASYTSAHGDARTADAPAVAVLPGGGASAVAHLVAVPFVVAIGWTIAGLAMWAHHYLRRRGPLPRVTSRAGPVDCRSKPDAHRRRWRDPLAPRKVPMPLESALAIRPIRS